MKDWNSFTVDRYWEEMSLPNSVAIGILDISRDIPSKLVQKRSFDMTYFYINRMLKMGMATYVGFHTNVKTILQEAEHKGMPYAMVACQGLLLYRGPSLITQSLEYANANPNFFVVGHVMDKEAQKLDSGSYPGLHRQYLFVNVQTWVKLGRPNFDEIGFFWDRKPVLHNYIVSKETNNSNYTPAWIKAAEGTKQYSSTADGSNWIDLACRNNIQIDNLTNDMRDCKAFLYPYTDTDKLEKVWYDLRSPIVNELSNQSQRAWIRKLGYQEEIEKDRVYVFNTETLSGEGRRTTMPIDALITPAAGFKPLSILRVNGFHKDTEVHYFDWCEASLNFKRHLLETWDGVNLHKWLIEYDLMYNFSSTYRGNYQKYWEQEVKEQGGPEAFKKFWDRYKDLKHKFHVIDIVNEPNKLFDVINQCNGTRVLWTTNIWSSEMLHWNVDPENLQEKWKVFEEQVPSDLVLYGHDYIAVDMQQRIRNGVELSHVKYESQYQL